MKGIAGGHGGGTVAHDPGYGLCIAKEGVWGRVSMAKIQVHKEHAVLAGFVEGTRLDSEVTGVDITWEVS